MPQKLSFVTLWSLIILSEHFGILRIKFRTLRQTRKDYCKMHNHWQWETDISHYISILKICLEYFHCFYFILLYFIENTDIRICPYYLKSRFVLHLMISWKVLLILTETEYSGYFFSVSSLKIEKSRNLSTKVSLYSYYFQS